MQHFAADIAQKGVLFQCFDAFRQDMDAQVLGHIDDGFHDFLRTVGKIRQEGHVQLDGVELVVLEDGERRIAAAKVVHPDLVARSAELIQRLVDCFDVFNEDTFCDFDAELRRRDLIGLGQLFDFCEDVAGDEIQPGQVEGHRDHGQALVGPGMIVLAEELENIQIEFVDLPAFFQGRDEVAWREQAPDRILPAGQGFKGARLVGQAADDGLEIELDSAFFDSFIDVMGDVMGNIFHGTLSRCHFNLLYGKIR